MADRTPAVLLDQLVFPECPRWHDGRLWFSDMHAHRVFAMAADGEPEIVLETEDMPAGIGWLPDGRLLVVAMVSRKLLRLDPGGLVEVADLSGLAPFHCNDMVVDAAGPRLRGQLRLRRRRRSRAHQHDARLRRARR